MAKTVGRVVVAMGLVVAALAGTEGAAFGVEPPFPAKGIRQMVLVDDSARVPAGILAQAREVAAKIFRDIDVELVWVERDDVRSFVKVRLLTREMTDRMEVPRSTLGMAEGTQLAVVFYNRIEELSPRNEKDTGCMLGHVIAHEIGHLLLPGEAHSLSGIMQAVLTLQLANRGGLFFTTFQAHSIRAKLGAS